MNAQSSARLNSAIRSLFSELNAGGVRFYVNSYPNNPRAAFGIAEKAPYGQLHPDGSKIKDHGFITRKQCEIIEASSQTEQEIQDRIKLLIIHKKDTTRTPERPPAIELSQVEIMVEEAVAKALAAVANKENPLSPTAIRRLGTTIARETVKEESLTSITNEQPTNRPIPPIRGIQMKKRKSPSEYGAEIDAENKIWADRVNILGIGDPVFRKNSRRIDEKWMAQAQKKWDEHLAKLPVLPGDRTNA